MVKSVTIVCQDSPIGKNSITEALRMGAGIMAVGDIESCNIVFMGDAVYFLSKNYNPSVLNMENPSNMFKMLEFAEIIVYVLSDALNASGIKKTDLIEYEFLKIVDSMEIAQIIANSDISYKY
ncbi:MAG: DsrE family protein [Candidatus Thorarchaeota archaeon]